MSPPCLCAGSRSIISGCERFTSQYGLALLLDFCGEVSRDLALSTLNSLILYASTDRLVAAFLGASILVLFIPRVGLRITPWIFGAMALQEAIPSRPRPQSPVLHPH